MKIFQTFWLFLFLGFTHFHLTAHPKVILGVDRIFDVGFKETLKNRNIGLITNHTGVNSQFISTIELFQQHQNDCGYILKALFAPEHGLFGEGYAGDNIASQQSEDCIPIHSLHGATRRPTKKMLEGIDLLVFDIQDLGARSYTFASTLYYAMEEAAKAKIPVLVLDRPNPMNGVIVDGPMLEERLRSFIGYLNVPYCHGMTIGELATFFNLQYAVGCDLTVVPMKGWKRSMSFADTGLTWVPTSPFIPEATTAYFYPATGLLGEFPWVSIGIGYTLPFKVVGAPWIESHRFAEELNHANVPGVRFLPIRFRPFWGSFAGRSCQGVFLVISDQQHFLPVTTQYLLMATLRRLYPKECKEAVQKMGRNKELFLKACGTDAIYDLLIQKNAPTLKQFCAIHQREREAFIKARKKYLFPEYQD